MDIPFLSGHTDTGFDDYDVFVPEHLPEPGDVLADHATLTGRDHAAVHRLARELFEKRGVYDVTFGYNLARLNLDHRHPDAGFRYARDSDDPYVLWAEFTPTTEFCPQSDTLTVGAFRAWNGLTDRHEFAIVRVRVTDHHRETAINARLADLDARYLDTGEVADTDAGDVTGAPVDAPF
jgi:hypothetical protein